MMGNPILGVFFHWLGGLSSATFYVPYRGVKRWNWEIFWLTGGIFSWLVAPWLFASIQTHDLIGVLSAAPASTKFYCVLFGVLWGFGGLTYGLTMRYLGLSLGMAVVLGLCTVFGTLIPPIVAGEFGSTLLGTVPGRINLLGLAITVVGIVVVALAGARKDATLSAEQKAAAVAEFHFSKGIVVAIFSGIMSSCYAFGLAAGEPIRELGAAAGTGVLWVGLPVICLVTLGGLITNGLWCSFLIVRNRSAGQWLGRASTQTVASDAGGRLPLLRNYLLSALGGTLWYFQFFFYTMGESQMGRFGFSSWTIHMASIIIFGTLWGFAFREWRDAAPATRRMVWAGVGLLVLATLVIGYGNLLAQ
ncbi:L-rhamnose/proton symporter RhaT [Sphingomonas sp. PL-96]|uniref:L-rhamnose/proton symporter RhaT n=1 Tax=Sphingomonas sp. PL-96 TaxID=2887201 RepID=UPI001E2E5B6F|nr:L-rhamnose/proton symporter RhaT [Sphingomonas sp. PL-96]MCC2978294.1 L-rhamnose/proton symporter RhaT [Sphingomonas sp. PL-96]